MKVRIPRNLDLVSSLNFCNFIDTLKEDDKYLYDYKNLSTVEPFGMLLIGSKIRKFVGEKESCAHIDCNFSSNSYAAHMGFFKSIYLDFGKKPGEANGSSSYIPITNINIEDKKKESIKNGIDIYECISSISSDVSKLLARNNKNLKKYLTYGVNELLRNVYEHSKSEEIWYAGQYWPSKDIVEISILDEGIGIKNSLIKNRKIFINNDEEALKLALAPGISNTGIGKIGKDLYDNLGFGLYMISNICKNSGDFVICSGSKCIYLNQDKTDIYETSFSGTAIRLRLKPSRLGSINNIQKELSMAGSYEAKKYKKLSEVSISSINNVSNFKI